MSAPRSQTASADRKLFTDGGDTSRQPFKEFDLVERIRIYFVEYHMFVVVDVFANWF